MHRNVKSLAILASAMVCYSGLAAAEDLMQVYQLAVDNDARFQAARYEFQASQEAIPQAKAGLLPEIALEGERIQTRQNIISSDNTVFATGSTKFPTNNYSLTVNIPIFHYDVWKGLSQAKLSVKQAQAEFSATEQDLMLQSAQAYFEVLAAQDELEFAQANKSAIGRQLDLAQARLDRGLATVTNLHDAKARYAFAESREVEAENALADAHLALQEFTGRMLTALKKLQGEIPLDTPDPTDVEVWLKTALAQNYALEAARQAVEIGKEEMRRQQAGHYPTLDFVGVYNDRDTQGSLFGGGSEVETTDYLLRLKLPLYQGGAVTSMTRESRMRYEQAVQRLEAETRSVTRETRTAYQGILGGIKNVEALKQSVVFQTSALEVKEEGFKAGMNTMLAVLDAQRDLYYAQRDHSKARYEYLLDVLRLKKASGTLSPNDIEQMNLLLADR
jgi:outer membrane protein